MTAIRGARSAEGRFVQLTNRAGQDERLSLEARGIIYLVLSLPPEQTFTRQWLLERVAGRNSRRNVDNALGLLEQFGYFRKTTRALGRGMGWIWEQVITDDPDLLTVTQGRSTETTSANTALSQVNSVDHHTVDVNRSTKELNTGTPKTVKDGPARLRRRPGGDAGLQVPGPHLAVTRANGVA